MRAVRLITLMLLAIFAIAACDNSPDTLEDAVSSLPSEEEVSDAAADIQSDIETFATELENSEAAETLQGAWADLESEIATVVASVTSDEPIDTEAVQAEFDEFQTDLEEAGDEVSDELRSAWNSLRSQLEQLMTE